MTPCVVRSNRAGKLVWAHMGGSTFELAYRLTGQRWHSLTVDYERDRLTFAELCKALHQ